MSSFPEVPYKTGILKNFSKFTDKHKKRSVSVLPKDVLKFSGWKPETVRSNHKGCSVKKGVLKNFANFTGKHLCWSLFLMKLQY